MEEIDRSAPLFDKKVPVQIEHPDRETKSIPLTVRVLTAVKNQRGQKQNMLHIELTDSTDPYFLFTLQVTEEDFHDLKSDQHLLVDFPTFPLKFIELLDSCVGGEGELVNSEQKESRPPSFLAVLSLKDRPLFKLVESNMFKFLTHLALRFQPGNDDTIKRYLASRLRQAMDQNSSLSSRLETAESVLSDAKTSVRNLEHQLNDLQQSQSTSIRELQVAHQAEVANLKEDFTREMAKVQNDKIHDAETRQSLNDEKVRALETRLEQLTSQHQRLQQDHLKLDSEHKALVLSATSTGNSLAESQHLVEKIRSENLALEQTKHEQEKEVNRQALTIAALQQQVADKDTLIKTSTDLSNANTEQQANAREKLAAYRSTISKLQRKLELSISEIKKGNQVIERLQDDIHQQREKIKVKSTVIRKQEERIDQMLAAQNNFDASQFEIEKTLQLEQKKVVHLESELRTATNKLEESNKALESNQNVIAYLNKEINQLQMGTSASPYVPLSSTTKDGAFRDGAPSASAASSNPYNQPTPYSQHHRTADSLFTPASVNPGAIHRVSPSMHDFSHTDAPRSRLKAPGYTPMTHNEYPRQADPNTTPPKRYEYANPVRQESFEGYLAGSDVHKAATAV